MFVRNCWYVAAWEHEVEPARPLGCVIIGEPVVLYRKQDGAVVALEDRCVHRHAPLSMGRVEGDDLRCMYHGLRFGADGLCKEIPGGPPRIPGRARVKTFPVVEQDSWIWVWMGASEKADLDLIPKAFGAHGVHWKMKSGHIDFAASYQLINDNLCDLSHLDYLHESSLGRTTGPGWAVSTPSVTLLDRGVRVERWFVGRPLAQPIGKIVSGRSDTWVAYDYIVPGVFLMSIQVHEHGVAERIQLQKPSTPPLFQRAEQQAVTPRTEASTRYFYATGHEASLQDPALLDGIFEVARATFAEDRAMIEGQQVIWNLTSGERPMIATPHDKAANQMRAIIARLIRAEKASSEASSAGPSN